MLGQKRDRAHLPRAFVYKFREQLRGVYWAKSESKWLLGYCFGVWWTLLLHCCYTAATLLLLLPLLLVLVLVLVLVLLLLLLLLLLLRVSCHLLPLDV